ncbi:diguanylate cyclase/phosphodiesterase [Parafrankia sp. EAN1pec]|nr:diguanylate cyclase/phosphodiesterase [Frankia sp. EAN1pec]
MSRAVRRLTTPVARRCQESPGSTAYSGSAVRGGAAARSSAVATAGGGKTARAQATVAHAGGETSDAPMTSPAMAHSPTTGGSPTFPELEVSSAGRSSGGDQHGRNRPWGGRQRAGGRVDETTTSGRRPGVLASASVVLLVGVVSWWAAIKVLAPSGAITTSLTVAAVACLPLSGLGDRMVAAVRRRWYGSDDLTGLPGRRHFVATASRWLGGGHRARGSVSAALILIDLDRLRDINGTLGHEHGDHMLATVGARLRSVLRPADLLARVDGDEFAVLLRDVDLAGAEAVARRIREALRIPVRLDDLRVQADVSVGIAHAPEHGRGILELMRRAEEAMYAAKGTHTGQRVYDPACQLGNRAQLGLRADLREALDGGQIELRYQPKAEMRSGRIRGVEALVRWRHPTGGLRPPNMFLPEMERAGLMGRLTQQVLDIALADCARWHAAGAALAVSVNVPASVIVDRGFVDLVRGALERHGLPASALVVEVTEDGLITVLEQAQRTLSGLRDHGVRVSLDDYGTGLCSLAYLRELPADEVKLDQRFLRDIDRDSSAAEIVRSTVSLAHALRLRIVAEGVETSRSWASLAAWQCDEVQGYFVSRPLAGERVLSWLREWGDRLRWLPSGGEPAPTGPIRVTTASRGARVHSVATAANAQLSSPAAGAASAAPVATASMMTSGSACGAAEPPTAGKPSLAVPSSRPGLRSMGFRMSQHAEAGSRRPSGQPAHDGWGA